MHKCLALCLTLLILLQSFSRELLVVDYALHKERITQLFCVNKAKPQLHCNGKCHLRRQLAHAGAEKKAPLLTAKIKLDAALPPSQWVVVAQLPLPAPTRYGVPPEPRYGHEPAGGVFRPPLS